MLKLKNFVALISSRKKNSRMLIYPNDELSHFIDRNSRLVLRQFVINLSYVVVGMSGVLLALILYEGIQASGIMTSILIVLGSVTLFVLGVLNLYVWKFNDDLLLTGKKARVAINFRIQKAFRVSFFSMLILVIIAKIVHHLASSIS